MIAPSHQRGMLLGLAVGDALGAAVEFKAPGTFPKVTGYRAGGPHGLNPGEWTDDTSMALALADSIATIGGTSTIRRSVMSIGARMGHIRSTAAASIAASRLHRH